MSRDPEMNLFSRTFNCRNPLKSLTTMLAACVLLFDVGPVFSSNDSHSPIATDLSQLIIEPDWLNANYKLANLVIVDTRKRDQYLKGHIEGAINIPVKSTFGKPPENDLIAPISHIQKLLGEAGIDNKAKIVLYDDGKHVDAARVFWVLEVYGHQQAAILNGGFMSWREKGLPVSEKVTKLPTRTYIPTIVPNILSTKFSTRLAINDDSKIIIDARSAEEYAGKESKTDRFGHIPNAINIPYYANFDIESSPTRLKSIADLETVYQNLDKNKKVIAYCNRGKESALTYFILRRLGFNVSAYDGSWLEWSRDNSLPVNTPAKVSN